MFFTASLILVHAITSLSFVQAQYPNNKPPTFQPGYPTTGITQSTITSTSGYAAGSTTCFCGPSTIPNYVAAVTGFMDQYCAGSWTGGASVQMQGVASFITDDTVVLVSIMPDAKNYFVDNAPTNVRSIDCYTISEFFNSATTSGSYNGCGGDMSFMCELSTYPASTWNDNYWDYQITIYNFNDQYWVTGNVDGIDPTNGLAYGGANILAGAGAAAFYPSLERLGGIPPSCAGASCANSEDSPPAFVPAADDSDDTNPCERRVCMKNSTAIPRSLRKRC